MWLELKAVVDGSTPFITFPIIGAEAHDVRTFPESHQYLADKEFWHLIIIVAEAQILAASRQHESLPDLTQRAFPIVVQSYDFHLTRFLSLR